MKNDEQYAFVIKYLKTLRWFIFPILILVGFAWYGSMDLEPDHPCNNQNVPAQCYSVARQACYTMWNNFESGCRREVRNAIGPNRVATLIGPAVKKCTQERFDKAFKYNRRTYSSESCESYFSNMDRK